LRELYKNCESESNQNEFQPEKAKGTVKWFNDKKGFGFIELDDDYKADGDNRDVFVHHSAIENEGESLNERDQVEFWIEEEPKGLAAKNVTKMGNA